MRPRFYRQLSDEERDTLSLRLARSHLLRALAAVLQRARSTLSRESAATRSEATPSRACTAQTQAATRARQPRRRRKLLDPWLWQYVQTQLAEACSPEQIAGRLRRAYPDGMGKRLSTETIYAGLYVLSRGTLRSGLLAALRQARKTRRPRAQGTHRRGQLPHMTPIAERPAEVATRTVPGHWEGDRGPQWLGCRHAGGADDAPGHSGSDGGDGCDECPPGLYEETPACAHRTILLPLKLRPPSRHGPEWTEEVAR